MKGVIGTMLVAAGVACADTLNVPGDYPTIQAAIDAASGGDVVLVADGTYSGAGNVNLDTLGKAITVKSQNGPGACAIDCQKSGRGFVVHSGEGTSTRIEGFAVKNGAADAGAGASISASSPTIASCVFTGGVAEAGGGVYSAGGNPTLIECQMVGNVNIFEDATGGGLCVVGGGATLLSCTISGNKTGDNSKGAGLFVKGGSLTLTGCAVSNNAAGYDYRGYGSGLAIDADASAVATKCTFTGNRTEGGSFDSWGGAVFSEGAGQFIGCSFDSNRSDIAGAVFADGPNVFNGCTFTDNGGYEGAGAVWAQDSAFIDCHFEGNGSTSSAGALFGRRLSIDRCTFVGNVTSGSGVFVGGGAIYSGDGNAVTNCVFAGNSDIGEGNGGALVTGAGDVVANCVFYGNAVDEGIGSAIWGGKAGAMVVNCIVRGAGGAPITGALQVTYSDVEGGFAGAGNIDADPLFIDPANADFHLGTGSPCIDAGSNPMVPDGIEADLDGAPRFYDDPATLDTGVGPPPVVDMGAYEFGAAACYADFTGDGVLDLFDFLGFVNAFNDGNPYADCTGDGAMNLFDFLCFVNAFNEGC